MKKIILPLMLFMLSWVGFSELHAQSFAGGAGTETDPFLIEDATHLDNVRNHLDAYFKQIADIDLDMAPWNEGEGWEPIGTNDTPFNGTYDGDNFAITNLSINRDQQFVGLFGYMDSNSYIKNLAFDAIVSNVSWRTGSLAGVNYGTIENVEGYVYVSGNLMVGGLTGENYGMIMNSILEGEVNGDSAVGGLAGRNYGLIEYSSFSGFVYAGRIAGGLAGENIGFSDNAGIISWSFSDGSVEGGDDMIGGLVGNDNEGVIEQSYSNSYVTGTTSLGGLIGSSSGMVSNSYALGDVAGSVGGENAGGFIGRVNDGHEIINCYSAGSVTGDQYLGGFIARLYATANITNSFYDTETSGLTTSAGGEGKTTVEMKSLSTFLDASWDFKGLGAAGIWNLGNERMSGYPYLDWQFPEDPAPEEPIVNALTGQVTNALDGQPIAGALVNVAGFDTYTDENGNYSFEELPEAGVQVNFTADVTSGFAPLETQFTSDLREGYHTITVTADGFSPYSFNSLSISSNETVIFDLSLSPVLDADANYRFVLNWGATPRDLDSHMLTPDDHHVFYSNQGSSTEAPFVTLDHDITTSYGPETTTVYELTEGTYHYYIYNYSGEAGITTSNAVVQIYDDEGLLNTLEVPETGDGRYWYVGTLDGATGRITIVDEIRSDISDLYGANAKFVSDTTLQPKAAYAELTETTGSWTYDWDFGDGTFSSEADPIHTYEEPGLYTVTLIATNEDGVEVMSTRREYIEVLPPEIIPGTLTGQVTNALDGQPIAGALVDVGGFEVLTDENGQYLIEGLPEAGVQVNFTADVTSGFVPLETQFTSDLREGYHTITVTADGFSPFSFGGLVINPEETEVFDLSLSPTLDDNTSYRFVLNWGATPRDLDSHMLTPDGHHIAYYAPGNATDAPFVTLDHDITTSYGPETITVYTMSEGIYHYYIHNYSGEADITTSNAVVQIYDEEGLLNTLEVPETGDGLYWYVGTLDGTTGRITIVDEIRSDVSDLDGANAKFVSDSALQPKAAYAELTQITGNWTYEWDFGDGSFSSEADPIHTYEDPGLYTVSLVATNEDGVEVMSTRREYIEVLNPAADIRAVDDTVYVTSGHVVRINPMENDTIPDDFDLMFHLDSWEANHGMLMPTADGVGFIYASTNNSLGTDDIGYSIMHEYGSTSATVTIHVIDGLEENQAPLLALPVEVSILEDESIAIPLEKLVFDDRDEIEDLMLEVASDNAAVHVQLDMSSMVLNIHGDEDWWGTATVTMTAVDSDGETSNDEMTITVVPVNDPPVALFRIASQELESEGYLVTFEDASHDDRDPEGGIAVWEWDFGDGNNSNEQHPQHLYTESGEFDIQLTVTDNASATAMADTTITVVIASAEGADAITTFRVHGNYPNPFNPTTTLRFDIPEAGLVTIDVYNSMGQRMARIKNEEMKAGRHTLNVDATNWASGMYIYRVRYNDSVYTRKMTFVK